MNRTKIEWVRNPDGTQGYTVNPVKGKCPMGCEYCYMWGKRGIGMRFHFDPTIRYDPRAWLGIGGLRKPSRIFVGSTIELFYDSLSPIYLKWILDVPLEFPQHTFIFLTKCPQNLPIDWPENCWVGVTATDERMLANALQSLGAIKTTIKFISLEPLLRWNTPFDYLVWESLWWAHINWLIIGAQTNPYKPPQIEWLREIVEAANKAGIPVFLKDNLRPLLIPEDCSKPNYLTEDIFWASEKAQLRQEMPE